MHRWGGQQAFPSVITVFSAPNYGGNQGNKGAVILIENEKMNIKQYKNVEHPFHLPDDIDLFQWSIPFLVDKITEMLTNVAIQNKAITPISEKELAEVDFKKLLDTQSNELRAENADKSKKLEILRTKVKAFARMNRIFKQIRENQEEILQIKKITSDGKLPAGIIIGGTESIHNYYINFYTRKMQDSKNEAFPTLSKRLSQKTRTHIGR